MSSVLLFVSTVYYECPIALDSNMKTEVASHSFETDKTISGKHMDEQKGLRGPRRTLHPLQKEAGDKENLVGAGRLLKDMPPSKEKTTSHLEGVTKKLKSKAAEEVKPSKSDKITADDLTSEEGPSSAYWERLAERRRVALEDALKENETLLERVKYLEEENAQCKILLDETRGLVETLTELLNNPDEEEAVENE